MFRFFDVLLSLTGLIIGLPLLILLYLIGLFDTGSPIFRQVRVGRNQKPFTLIKFRTMSPAVASVPTHLVDATLITPFGRLLRRTKLDELPQLWNVLRGDMSLVGPRPCLPSQHELIRERALRDVFAARPGITGLAQLQGIDMSDPVLLARVDQAMLGGLTLSGYFRFILLTVMGNGAGDRAKE